MEKYQEKLEEFDFIIQNCTTDNWNSEGSCAVTQKVLHFAYIILLALEKEEYELSVHPHGTISFERINEQYQVSFEVGNNNYSIYLKNSLDLGQTEYKYGINKNINELLESVHYFLIKPFQKNNNL